MRILSSNESQQLSSKFSRVLVIGLVLAGLAAAVMTVDSVVEDRRTAEAQAHQEDATRSLAIRIQAELILDQSHFSIKAVVMDLFDAADTARPVQTPSDAAALRALRSAMRYDPASSYLFVRRGDVVIAVNHDGQQTDELDALVAKIDPVSSNMKPVLQVPLSGGTPAQPYLPLLLAADVGPGSAMTVGGLIPLAKLKEYGASLGPRTQRGEGLNLLDGTVLMTSMNESQLMGRRTPMTDAMARQAAGRDKGDFNATTLDGQVIAGAFSRSLRYPFIAASAQLVESYLAPWRARSYARALGLAVALAVIGWGARTLSRANSALSASERVYRQLFEDVAEAIVVFRVDGTILSINSSALALMGAQRAEHLIGQNILTLSRSLDGPEVSRQRVERVMGGEHLHFETSYYLPTSDRQIDCVVRMSPIQVGKGTHLMSVVRDVTQERRHVRQQEFLANHEPLTGLPNRLHLMRTLDRQIEAEANTPIYLILINLARFKEINESFGHRAGDTVLEVSAQRLAKALAERDWTLSRLGGTDLVAMAVGDKVAELDAVRQLVFEVLNQPLQLDGIQIALHARLGITCYPADALDASQLLRCADLAIKQAKNSVAHWACYDRELDNAPGHDLKMRSDLATAIRDGQLSLNYQPKVWLKDRKLAGAEALLRWRHPTQGWIPPSEFIPLAESTELIQPLTRWVLNEALLQIQRWHEAGKPITLAVNISTNNLQDPDFNPYVIDLLQRRGVMPELLDLEVTEGALANNPEIVLRRLHELRSMGIGLSLDDFGTGFSSLSYVSQFPFTSIKIDRSFVSALLLSPRDRQVALSTISLGRNLHLKTIAEGVEDEATTAALLALDCDIGQGYLFGRPMAIADFDNWRLAHEVSLETAAAHTA